MAQSSCFNPRSPRVERLERFRGVVKGAEVSVHAPAHDSDVQHLLQAERLSTDLHEIAIRGLALAPPGHGTRLLLSSRGSAITKLIEQARIENAKRLTGAQNKSRSPRAFLRKPWRFSGEGALWESFLLCA